jgi:hypothetical protein
VGQAQAGAAERAILSLLQAEIAAETLEEEGSPLAAVYTPLGLYSNHTGFLYLVSWQLRDQIWLRRNGAQDR